MKADSEPLVLILAGGTGGHVYPALAVALALRESGAALLWLGLADKIEARVARDNDIEFVRLRGTGIRGKKLFSRIAGLGRILIDCIRLYFWLGKHKPAAAAGFGGYSSFAAGVACWLRRVPLLVHEQNAVAGSANKLLARLATTVCLGYQGSLPVNSKTHFTGNPVRAGFEGFRQHKSDGALRLLVLGGSLGAASINRAVGEAVTAMDLPHGLTVVHQCGRDHLEPTTRLYQSAADKKGLSVDIQPFLNPVMDYYSEADLVVCRAGAMTLAELAVCRLPALLIPFPHAIDDHQRANADALVQTGGAWMLSDRECSGDRVGEWLQTWCNMPPAQARTEIRKVGRRLDQVARPDAASVVAKLVFRETE